MTLSSIQESANVQAILKVVVVVIIDMTAPEVVVVAISVVVLASREKVAGILLITNPVVLVWKETTVVVKVRPLLTGHISLLAANMVSVARIMFLLAVFPLVVLLVFLLVVDPG